MNTLEAMQARRSIRKFRPDAVSDDLVRKIIQAGIWAPSGRNRQPWQFYVVRGERRVEMMSAMQAGMEKKTRRRRVHGQQRELGAHHG